MVHPTTILIDRSRLVSNLKAVKGIIPNETKYCLPVKANAYGHGIEIVALTAEPYVDYFAVACLNEGALLRKIGITKPILVLGAIDEDQIPGLIDNDLEITIASKFKAGLLSDFCRKIRRRCKVHIKVDTGMNRVGIRAANAGSLIDSILSDDSFELVGIYSHFAESEDLSDSFTRGQTALFSEVADYAKNRKSDIICHLANSGAICYHPETSFDMVRPGILSYGYFPGRKLKSESFAGIAPCFTLKTKVVYFKAVEHGSFVSYNRKYEAEGLRRIITLPIGYGDGYRRALSNKAEVIVRGRKYRVAGNVCMDMTMIDLGEDGTAYVGDEVTVIGFDEESGLEIPIEGIADLCATNVYEILCGFNNRIPRMLI